MGTRILIAEDEPYILESLSFLLTREGHAVESVMDGAAIMQAIRLHRPDLLILDVMLPTTNGFDALRKIRATDDVRHLPVLALTAKGQKADRQRMLDLGADDFVTKPFSNKDLVARVARLLNGAPLEDGGQVAG
ncbi:MAG: response regulator [Rhodobacterales bacterium]|nr:response regulator [Rhodobacterales bacterium]